MQKLIKLSDTHYIVVDDSEIKEGDWYYWEVTKTIQIAKLDSLNRLPKNSDGSKKITHSTQPLEEGTTIHGIEHKRWVYIKYIDLSEVKELIGEVDVNKKAEQEYREYPNNPKEHPDWQYGRDTNYHRKRKAFIKGYKQALEDNKEKKYTEEDLRKAIEFGYQLRCNNRPINSGHNWVKDFIAQSLQPKTEWEVEFDEQGKLRLL